MSMSCISKRPTVSALAIAILAMAGTCHAKPGAPVDAAGATHVVPIHWPDAKTTAAECSRQDRLVRAGASLTNADAGRSVPRRSDKTISTKGEGVMLNRGPAPAPLDASNAKKKVVEKATHGLKDTLKSQV